jgi:hypothetical protein
MECNRTCKGFCSWIREQPPHVNYNIPKEGATRLPPCFEETYLGEMEEGAKRQYRGPYGAHVREFPDRWVLHRDHVNADQDPLGHLLKDAPEYLASALAGALAGLATGRHQKSSSIQAALLASALTLASGKLLKLLNGDQSDGRGRAPKID